MSTGDQTPAIRLARAREMLADAVLLLQAGSRRSAVNRAYYAAFHAARAMLATAGVETRKHAGVLSFFDREFIKSGRLDLSCSETLHDLYEARTDAD
jgi:uncharacterized protein (UPF0332 family)